jgi:sugar lactone lactonase YvrE
MMNGFQKLLLGGIILVVLLPACATTPPPNEERAVYFPAPPALPRLQYLKSYTGAKDIQPDASGLDAFLTGKQNSEARLLKPYGAAIHDGKIYVCDSNATVMVFNLKEKTYRPLAGAKGMGKLVQPLNISIDGDGTKFVADPIRGQVVSFDSNDFFLRAYGIRGGWKPVDAATFADRLYVVDGKNKQVRVFDKQTGDWIKTIGSSGPLEERLGLPTNIAFDAAGTMYVSDAGRIQVVKYDRDGHYLGHLGQAGSGPGYFARPRGLTLDREGRVFIVDAAFDNVQVFGTDGQMLMFFGGPGARPGNLSLPAKVIIDYDNIQYFKEMAEPDFEIESLVLVTSQFGDRLVNIYGFGKRKGADYPSLEKLKADALKRVEEWKENPAASGEKHP